MPKLLHEAFTAIFSPKAAWSIVLALRKFMDVQILALTFNLLMLRPFLIACTSSVSWVSEFSPNLYTVVSAAKSVILLFEPCFGKSLIYTNNKNGFNFEPCGTSVCQFVKGITSVSIRNKLPTIKQIVFQQLMNWSSESIIFQFFQKTLLVESVKCFFQVNDAAVSFVWSLRLFVFSALLF